LLSKKYWARRVAWSILLALGARDPDSNSGGPISSNFLKCVKKHELESYVRFRQLEGLNKNWLYQVELFIKNYLSFCSWKISKEKTLKYLNKIQNEYSISSYRKQILQIRRFLRYLDLDWLNKLKIIGEPEYTPRRISEGDIEGVLNRFKGHTYELQVRALVYLGASSGLRAEELYQLTPRDLDIENRIVYVNHNPQNKQTTKTKKSRVSFFNTKAQRALKLHIGDFELKHVFGQSHMRRLFRDSPVKVKDLRKKFSQHWTKNNGSSSVKKILMGHSLKGDVDLMHYNYQSEEDLKRIYDEVMK